MPSHPLLADMKMARRLYYKRHSSLIKRQHLVEAHEEQHGSNQIE
jgi:hypothetical protein